MPSLGKVLKRFTKQFMLYFEKQGDDPSGRPTYADPVLVKCRWEDKVQEIVVRDGRRTISKGYILIGQALVEGSIVFLGTTIPSTAASVQADWKKISTYPLYPPTQNEGGREVLLVKTTPDIGAQSYIFEVYL